MSSGYTLLHSWALSKVFAFLSPLETLHFQSVSRYLYSVGVARVQIKVSLR